jgi:hypothetical protein
VHTSVRHSTFFVTLSRRNQSWCLLGIIKADNIAQLLFCSDIQMILDLRLAGSTKDLQKDHIPIWIYFKLIIFFMYFLLQFDHSKSKVVITSTLPCSGTFHSALYRIQQSIYTNSNLVALQPKSPSIIFFIFEKGS